MLRNKIFSSNALYFTPHHWAPVILLSILITEILNAYSEEKCTRLHIIIHCENQQYSFWKRTRRRHECRLQLVSHKRMIQLYVLNWLSVLETLKKQCTE